MTHEELPRCDEDTHYWPSHREGASPATGAPCKCGKKTWVSEVIPEAGWKHTTDPGAHRRGGLFGWYENGKLWSGIVCDVSPTTLTVRVSDIRPGRIVR